LANTRLNVHLYPSTFRYESRILRETRALIDLGLVDAIEIVARWEAGLDEFERIDDKRTVWRVRGKLSGLFGDNLIGKLFFILEWWVRVLCGYFRKEIAVINCHSLSVLPIGCMLKWFRQGKLIYDTHELETETRVVAGIRKKLAKATEKWGMRWVDELVVVSPSIGAWYESQYPPVKAHTIRNLPDRVDQQALKTVDLKQKLGIHETEILFVYYGIIAKGRGIELLIDAFQDNDAGGHIVFIGYGPLDRLVMDKAKSIRQVHFHDPVPPQEVLAYAASADIGVALIENVSLSYYYCLPNKLFEYLACGIPVLVSNFPDMSAVVDDYQCGWKITPAVDSMLRFLQDLSLEDVAQRRHAAGVAGQELTWENEKQRLVKLMEDTAAAR
jgi:glycosyltransferase involved in cell wall biosynthesis